VDEATSVLDILATANSAAGVGNVQIRFSKESMKGAPTTNDYLSRSDSQRATENQTGIFLFFLVEILEALFVFHV
jgi:hypothetical protein